MKADLSLNRVAYPELSEELVDLVSQQPETAPAEGVRPRRLAKDQYLALKAAGLSTLDRLSSRGANAVASHAFVPRPSEWNKSPVVFHENRSRELLKSAALALGLNQKLDEILSKVAGQITDPKYATTDIQSLLPRDFKGMVFKPAATGHYEPIKFIRERSMHSVDELRSRFVGRAAQKVLTAQESSEKATALLQLRTKLAQLARLGNFIDECFADLDAVDLGKLKTPQLC
jgi:hypothetical protein